MHKFPINFVLGYTSDLKKNSPNFGIHSKKKKDNWYVCDNNNFGINSAAL